MLAGQAAIAGYTCSVIMYQLVFLLIWVIAASAPAFIFSTKCSTSASKPVMWQQLAFQTRPAHGGQAGGRSRRRVLRNSRWSPSDQYRRARTQIGEAQRQRRALAAIGTQFAAFCFGIPHFKES